MAGIIEYDIKDLLDKLSDAIEKQMTEVKASLAVINTKLDDKATNSRVETLEKELEHFKDKTEKRISHLEIANAGAVAVSKFQRWGIAVLCSGLVGSLLYIVAAGGHA